jgi:hypothetical protein
MLYLYPSEDFMLSIRLALEEVVDPCTCPRWSGDDEVEKATTMKMVHGISAAFRDTVLIVPISSAPGSGSAEIRLHSATHTATPR